MEIMKNIYFLDIETVSQEKSIPDGYIKELFGKKFKKEIRDIDEQVPVDENGEPSDGYVIQYYQKAALYAEFGKIVSVSIGVMIGDTFWLKTYTSDDEKSILEQISIPLNKATVACAHNGMEFDFPFIARRMMVYGLPIPNCIDSVGKKPWEVNLLDTMKMWSGTQWNHKVSLDMLAYLFGLPSPKTIMSGASVSDVYYGLVEIESDELVLDKREAALKLIGKYNAGDVITLANCFAKMKGFQLIDPNNIKYS